MTCRKCGTEMAFRSSTRLCAFCMLDEPTPLTDHVRGKHQQTVPGCALCQAAPYGSFSAN